MNNEVGFGHVIDFGLSAKADPLLPKPAEADLDTRAGNALYFLCTFRETLM